MRAVIVDTGPLVAYFDRDDRDHARVSAWFARQASEHRLLTTEAVVTERQSSSAAEPHLVESAGGLPAFEVFYRHRRPVANHDGRA